MHFEWKTNMHADSDEVLRQRVLNAASAANASRRVLVLLSGGVAHFSRFSDHKKEYSFALSDDFDVPAAWIDSYVNDTLSLFGLFAPAALPTNVCVLWKTMNIVSRHNGTMAAHHPSSVNGLHHYLNRFTGALARRHGIGVVDVSELTRRLQPRGYRSADASGGGGSEGDPYHGYPEEKLLPAVLERMCVAAQGCRGWPRAG